MALIYDTILNSVVTSLSGTPGIPNIVLRRKLVMVKGDTPPIVIVAPGRGGEKVVIQTFGNIAVYAYPVVVAYINSANETLTINTTIAGEIDERELIRDQLFQVKLPNAVTVFDTFIDPDEITEFAAFVGTSYDVTGFKMIYHSDEQRNS